VTVFTVTIIIVEGPQQRRLRFRSYSTCQSDNRGFTLGLVELVVRYDKAVLTPILPIAKGRQNIPRFGQVQLFQISSQSIIRPVKANMETW
jgi:hypothetical protein